MKFGKWIGGGLGWAIGGPIGGIIGYILGSVVDEGVDFNFDINSGQQSKSGRTTSTGYIMSLLVLISAVMKADGKVMKSELDYVKTFLKNNFGTSKAADSVRILKDLLKQSIPIADVSRQIRDNMNYSARLQLLHFLFGLANADQFVHEKELEIISFISREMGVSNSDYESIKSMFVRITNADYKILEIDKSATDEEVKKAYRRMAMKYHPDKVSSLGKEIQEAAKVKFQRVNQAYENIKKERGMS